MKTPTLTSRERVRRMFERKDHDRVPRSDWYWKETLERWNSEGFQGRDPEALKFLGADFLAIAGVVPKVYSGPDETVREDEETRVVRDSWGGQMRYWKRHSGTPEHLAWECSSREIWDKQIKPRILSNPPDANILSDWKIADIPEGFRKGREEGRWLDLGAMETFELLRRLLGDETMLIAMAEEPEWIRDISDTLTDRLLLDLNRLYGQGLEADGLWIFGDMAFNKGPFCSPRMYRELVWPNHRRITDWAHQHRMKTVYHTDGNVNSLIGMYIEAGFDMLHPLEAKAKMDVREMAPKYGERLAFFGNVDMAAVGSNDPAVIENEVRSKLAAGMACKGYAYHADHSVPPTVSWESYKLIVRLLDRFGSY